MTDKDGRLKLFSAVQLLQDCSEMWKEQEPVFRDYLREHGAAQLLAFRQLEILRVPRLHEELRCCTTVFDCRGANGFRNTVISDACGNPCYVSWCQGAFVRLQTGQLLRIPQEVVESMRLSPRYEMEYRSRKIQLPAVPEIVLPSIAVQRNDIDYNGHVNNAHYLRMALELLPAGFEPASMRVEYKYPARYGMRLQPVIQEGQQALYVTLRAGQHTCCVMEFSRAAHSNRNGWYAW